MFRKYGNFVELRSGRVEYASWLSPRSSLDSLLAFVGITTAAFPHISQRVFELVDQDNDGSNSPRPAPDNIVIFLIRDNQSPFALAQIMAFPFLP